MTGGPGTGAVHHVPGAQVFYVNGRTGDYMTIVAEGKGTCRCPATSTCWHIREAVALTDDPISALQMLAADRDVMAVREHDAVMQAREDGLSWRKIGAALGRTSEGVRKRYGRGT